MCDFVSALEYEGKYYFLDNDKLDSFIRSKKGIKWLKEHGSIHHEDVKGHGFLEEFIYPELKGKAKHWECTDFSSQKNFPEPIVKALKSGLITYAVPDGYGQLLSTPARAEYAKVCAPAWAEYEKVRDAAWAEYNKMCAPAWAEYEKVRDAAWAEYNKMCAQARAEYEKVRDAAQAEYAKVRDAAWAEYEKMCVEIFWKLFTVKKNRSKNWKQSRRARRH